jgi:hypothetical protein
MTTTIKFTMLSLAASAILVGCGSSNTSTSTNTTENTNNLETGYFIDAPVEGLSYTTTSGEKGVTDQYGRFHYKHGDKVKFTIGKLDFGEATPDQEGLVTPQTISQGDDTLKLQILRVLQALDSDNDPSNGITIPEDVITALTTNLVNEVSLSEVKDDNKILELNPTLAEKLDEDYDGHIDVDDNAAQAHFEQSISHWKNGSKPDQNTQENDNDMGTGHQYGNGNGIGKGQGSHQQGQQNGQGGQEHQGGSGSAGNFDLSQYPVSTLTQDVKDALAYMGNEERLAYDVYMNLYNYHLQNGDEIRQMINIASRSESTHVQIVQDLVKRYNLGATDLSNVENPVADNNVVLDEMPSGQYDIPAIQSLYDTLYTKGIQSVQDALEVGCMVEVTDIDDLDKWIAKAEEANATDVIEGFQILRAGSYNHYWAFDKGLKNMGVVEGCGVLGADFAKTKEEYPSSH